MTGLRRWVRHRAGPLLVLGLLLLLAFLQAPGLILADTKLDLVLDPVGFLDRSRDLWDPTANFGQIPNQAVGYWFPTGPFFALGDIVGIPGWITQRLWIGGILGVSFWGMLRVAEALEIGSPFSRTIGALTYALTPTMLLLVSYRSAGQLPTALLPLAVLPLITGTRAGSPRRAAARSILAVALMGAANGAATLLVLPVPVLYLLTRAPGPRRRALMGWWGVLLVAVSMWWIIPLALQQRYGVDFLAVTEGADATTSRSSLSDVVRGTSYWEAGLEVEGQPWLSAGVTFARSALTILGTAVIAAVGLTGLTLARMRERRFLVLVFIGGVTVMSAGYVGSAGGPTAHWFRDLLDGSLAPLRSVHKLAPLVAFPIALGVAHAVGRASAWLDDHPRPRVHRLLRPAGAVACAGVLAVASAPLLTGDTGPPGAFEDVPEHWQDAIDFLNENGTGQHTLLVPGAAWAEYDWGRPLDEPLQPLAEDPWAARSLIPLGGFGEIRVLDEIENLFEEGRGSQALAPFLRRSGVEWLLVRNDLGLDRRTASSPRHVRRVLADSPGLTRVRGWGPTVVDPLTRARLAPELEPPTPALQAVELYRVDGPTHQATVAPAETTVIASGAPESALTLMEAGLLEEQPMVLTQDLRAQTDDAIDRLAGGPWVITDDLRRRDLDFGRVHDGASYTLTATEEAPDASNHFDGTPFDWVLEAGPGDLAVARYDGVESVSASSYFTGYARRPGYLPSAALDGSTASMWGPEAFRSPVDEWWEVRFDRDETIPWITVHLPRVRPGAGGIQRLTVTTDAGTTTMRLAETTAGQSLRLPTGPTRRLRLTIAAARQGFFDPHTPSIAEVELGGLAVSRTVAVPDRPPRTATGEAPSSLVFSRERSDPFELAAHDEEILVDRSFGLEQAATFRVTGTVSAVVGVPTADQDPDEVDGATASSRWNGLPAFRAEHAVDDDPRSTWLADPTDARPTLELRLGSRRVVSALRVSGAPPPAEPISRIRVSAGGESRVASVDEDGLARFEPLAADRIEVSFPPPPGTSPAEPVLVGVRDIRLAGGSGAFDRVVSRPVVRIPCGQGPPVIVDGREVATRVTGTSDDAVASRELTLRTCRPVTLAAGDHRIQSGDGSGFRLDTLVLSRAESAPPATDRPLEILDWQREQRTVALGAGTAAVLMVAENANDGWEATLDGDRLEAVTIDGWRQGWLVPAGEGGRVELDFGPGRIYDLGLQLGLLLALGALLALVIPGRATAAPTPGRALPSWFLLAAGTVAGVVVAGPFGLAVPVFAECARRRAFGLPWIERILPIVAGGAFLIAGTLSAARFWTPLVDHLDVVRPVGVGQALAAIALAAVFARAAAKPALDR